MKFSQEQQQVFLFSKVVFHKTITKVFSCAILDDGLETIKIKEDKI